MNDKDLRSLATTSPKPKAPKQSQEDPTAKFDVNRKARQAALKTVKEILQEAAQGTKLSRKKLMKALESLVIYDTLVDEIVVTLMKDMYQVIQAFSASEVQIFALRTNYKALSRALMEKELLDADRVQEIHDKEVLPEEIERIKQRNAEQQMAPQNATSEK